MESPAVLGGNILLQSGGGVFDPQSFGGFTITAPISGTGSLTVASDNNTFGGTVFFQAIIPIPAEQSSMDRTH